MSKKNSNWKWNALAIAAAVTAVAVPASAEDVKLEGTIPFAFSINTKVNLAAGDYTVTRDRNVWWFRNQATLEAVAIANYTGHQGEAGEAPSLTFECRNDQCQLRFIRVGGIDPGAEMAPPRLSKSERAEVAALSVALKPIPGK
jgi:hypothetical protein